MPFLFRSRKLNHSDIYSGRPLLPFLYVKGYAIAPIKGFKTGLIDKIENNLYLEESKLYNCYFYKIMNEKSYYDFCSQLLISTNYIFYP